MLEVKEVRKSYGLIEAVKGVSFTAEKGQILGFLCPNGAGKSTTMRVITGFLPPTDGTAVVCGHDILRDPVRAKKQIGYLPENAPAYADMTATNFLGFAAELRGFHGAEKARRVDAAIEKCRLQSVRHQTIGTLSKGYRQRVCFAQAVLHDPPVLIMDEPTDGLDPNQKHVVRTMIKEMAAEKTIVISTHILEEVDAICTHAIIISGGLLVAKGTPAELRSRSESHGAVELTVDQPAADILDSLRNLPSARRVDQDAGCYTIYPREPKGLFADVTALVRSKPWHSTGLRTLDGRLDDVFKKLTIGSDTAKVK